MGQDSSVFSDLLWSDRVCAILADMTANTPGRAPADDSKGTPLDHGDYRDGTHLLEGQELPDGYVPPSASLNPDATVASASSCEPQPEPSTGHDE